MCTSCRVFCPREVDECSSFLLWTCWWAMTFAAIAHQGLPLGSALSFFPMEGFPPGSAWGFSPLTITTAFVRGGRFGRRCAVLPRNLLICLIHCCDQSSTCGYLCANGRTGHAVSVALVLSDAPFNLKLAITVTRVLPIPYVLFTCWSMHLRFAPCLGIIVRPCRCLLYTSPSPRDQRGSRMPSSA